MKYRQLDTEMSNEKSKDLDMKSTEEILRVINDEDQSVALKVKEAIPDITKAIDGAYHRMISGGRFIYIGAGTSGRIGVLDASECPPTFGVNHNLFIGVIAGGMQAMTQAIENIEDYDNQGVEDLKQLQLNEKDVVCGIAASGRTPYVLGGIHYAKSIGALTIGLSCVRKSKLSEIVHYPVEIVVGPEVISGSTRMKAGTAEKLVLNMISSTLMIKMGKVYQNYMIDVQAKNEKLRQRAIKIVESITHVSYDYAKTLLERTNYNVKLTLLMITTDKSEEECLHLIQQYHGHISTILRSINEENQLSNRI